MSGGKTQLPKFPRSDKYNPAWIRSSLGGGAHPLHCVEWLSEVMDFKPGMRVLDLGSGKAASSIFLAKEFDLEVWSVDLWISADENAQRIRDAGLWGKVIPLHTDARSLPFAGSFFDAIVSIDSYYYYGTDHLYLNYLAHFLAEGGQLGVAGAGLVQSIDKVPSHLRNWWTQDLWSLMSADELAQLWSRTGIVNVEHADTMPNGIEDWLAWHHFVNPDGSEEIEAVKADAGRYLGYVRVVGRRQPNVKLEEYCRPDPLKSFPSNYEYQPVFASAGKQD